MASSRSGYGHSNRGAGDRGGRLLLDGVRLTRRAVVAASGDGATAAAVGGPAPLHPEKVRCEAAMLLRAATPLTGRVPGLAAELSGLAAQLQGVDADELAVRLCLHPGVALDLALVPVHLRSLGRGEPRLDALLEDLFGNDRLHGPERPANRELEQLWLRGIWSGEVEPGGVARALAGSSLAWEFDHLAGTTDDAYAFTHSILYATDNGRRRVGLPRPVGEIEADAEGILAVALDAGNHDVAAEVLWTWPMLRLPLTPLASAAGAFLADVSQGHGFLPGPGFQPSTWQGLAESERELYALRTSYHTTLVHGLLLAASLSLSDTRLHGPSARPDASPRAVPSALRLLPPRSTSGAWWSWFARLSGGEQDRLAVAVIGIALRRAATAADLGALHRALDLAEARRLTEEPLIGQARVLLRRALTYAHHPLADPVGSRA